ncbi:MAG: PQQ-binding-like beta-propeller repeat protein [Candidatus Omnitrophota bacterium]
MTQGIKVFIIGVLFISVFVCEGLINSAGADTETDWPMFLHDLQHTGCSFCEVPDELKMTWSYKTGGNIESSPAVANGKVFVGSWDNKFYVLDENTGGLIWSYQTGGAINSSPAVANGKVFIGSADNELYALDEDTGERIWSHNMGGDVWPSPAIANGKVFIGSYSPYNNKFYALDEDTGELIWSYRTGELFRFSSPAIANGKVFVGSYGGTLYALDEEAGGLIWSYFTGSHIYSSPAVANGKVFVVTSSNNFFHALDEETGDLIWSYQIGGNMRSSPAVANGKVFFGSEGGNLYAFGYSVITSVQVTPYSTWAELDWQTKEPTTTQIEYGTTTDYGTIIEYSNLDTQYHTELYGLELNTKYYFKIHSFAEENKEYTHTGEFTTVNHQPILELIRDKVINEEELLEFIVSAINLDRDLLSYSASNLPDGATLNSETQTFTWTPTYIQAGEYKVTFSVRDDYGKEDSESVIVQVDNVPDDIVELAVFPDSINCSGDICNVTVHNLGDVSLENVRVAIYAGDPQGKPDSEKKTGELTISQITAGASTEVSFDLSSLVSGSYNFFVWIDPYGEIEEFNEENNIVSKIFSFDWPMVNHDLQHTGYSPCEVPNELALAWSYEANGCVRSSPAVVNGKVFFGSDDNKLYAVDEVTGDLIWSYETGGDVRSSPAVSGGKVFFGSDDKKIYALDAETGNFIWSYETGGCVRSSPSIAYGKVFFGSAGGGYYDGKLYALDAETGEFIWSYKIDYVLLWSSPTIADGKVFFGTDENRPYYVNEETCNRLYALDAETGEFLWSYQASTAIFSSPVAYGKVFFSDRSPIGAYRLYALDAETGDIVWSYQTNTGGAVSSPAIANGKVFVGSDDNKLYALDVETGELIRSYNVVGAVKTSPSIADGRAFFGSGTNLYAVDENTGDIVWSYNTGGTVSSPAIANGKVFVGSWDGKLYSFGQSFIFSIQITHHHSWAEIDWQTKEPTTTQIEYGITTDYGTMLEGHNLETQHHIELHGLGPDTKYYFKIHSFTEDGTEYTYTKEFTTNNQPPFIESIEDKKANEKELLEFTVIATDPNEDVLTYSAANLPEGAVFDPETQTFSWKPTYIQAGEYKVIFKVRDNYAAEDYEGMTIEVDNVPADIVEAVSFPEYINIFDNICEVGVHNVGDVALEDIRVFLYAGDPLGNPNSEEKIGEAVISEISPGNFGKINFSLDVNPEDIDEFFVWVDPCGEIEELNEENNILSKRFFFDWPMFNHDLQHTGYSPSEMPDKLALLWSYEMGNSVSPPCHSR